MWNWWNTLHTSWPCGHSAQSPVWATEIAHVCEIATASCTLVHSRCLQFIEFAYEHWVFYGLSVWQKLSISMVTEHHGTKEEPQQTHSVAVCEVVYHSDTQPPHTTRKLWTHPQLTVPDGVAVCNVRSVPLLQPVCTADCLWNILLSGRSCNSCTKNYSCWALKLQKTRQKHHAVM